MSKLKGNFPFLHNILTPTHTHFCFQLNSPVFPLSVNKIQNAQQQKVFEDIGPTGNRQASSRENPTEKEANPTSNNCFKLAHHNDDRLTRKATHQKQPKKRCPNLINKNFINY
jgi:hypothetical protein